MIWNMVQGFAALLLIWTSGFLAGAHLAPVLAPTIGLFGGVLLGNLARRVE